MIPGATKEKDKNIIKTVKQDYLQILQSKTVNTNPHSESSSA